MSTSNVDDVYPLTSMQHLMLLHALGSGDTVLANQVVYEIGGDLDVERFLETWRGSLARHPALRTAFLWDGLERPVQVVRSEVPLPFQVEDLRAMGPAQQDARIAAYVLEDRKAPFRLEKAPLLRGQLFRVADSEHVFVWTVHHLVVDRWSYATLLQEQAEAYGRDRSALRDGTNPGPPFRSYVQWVLGQPDRIAADFWRQHLKGFHTPSLLARRNSGIGAPRRSTRRQLGRELTDRLETAAAQSGTTLGSWLQAAVALTLARRLRRGDVVFGLTVAGRPHEVDGVEQMVGSFVNNVPCRIAIPAEHTSAEWVRELQREQARRYRHEYLSLAAIHETAQVPAGQPLFDLLLVLNLTEPSPPSWAGLTVRTRSATMDAGYPLVVACGYDSGALVLDLVHDASMAGDEIDGILQNLTKSVQDLTYAEATTRCGDLLGFDVRESLLPQAPATEPSRSGAGDRQQQLLELWQDVLGVPRIGLDDDFFALGGTSLQAAQLFLRIERALGTSLPLSTLFRAGSVRRLLQALDEPVAPAGPLIGIRSGGRLAPLFVVPGIGGNVVGLESLARLLGPEQPFFGLQSRGLTGEQLPLESIEAIAEDYAELVAAQGEGPVRLLGLCWGAAVAFEMVERLRHRGRSVETLALLDPAVLLRERGGGEEPRRGFLRERLDLYWDEFRGADWRERGRLVLGKAKRAADALRGGGLPEESQMERNQHRVREANRLAVTRYEPAPLRVTARVFITSDRLLPDPEDPRLEWLSLIEPRPDVTEVPGVNSGDALAPGRVGSLATSLREWLGRAHAPL